MRILYVITGLEIGGAERQVSLIATTLSERGETVGLVSLIPPKNFVAELEASGVHINSLNMMRGKPSLSALFRLNEIINNFQPDVIHSHMYHANIICRLLKYHQPSLKLVSTAHSLDECRGSSVRAALYRLTARKTDYFTNVTQQAYDHFLDKGFAAPGKGGFVRNGISFRNSANNPRPTIPGLAGAVFRWITVGRLVSEKNHSCLLEAVQLLVGQGITDFLVDIVGDGPQYDSLASQIVSRGLQGRVSLLGLRDDVPALLNGADAFVLSSRIEGMPLALLEAFRAELPVVTTDIPGVSDVVKDAQGSTFVCRNGDPRAIAEVMSQMMKISAQERLSLGRAGYSYVNMQFSIEAVCDRWQEIYINVCK